MIDLNIKAYPDPARNQRIECIDRARLLASSENHIFEIMTNEDVQKYFTTPVEDLDYGPYENFSLITNSVRFIKASSIYNLFYLDTDVYLNRIPVMEPGMPYFSNKCLDCMIGSNDCCKQIRNFVKTGFFDNNLYRVFNNDDYEHRRLSQKRFVDDLNNPIPQIFPNKISTDRIPNLEDVHGFK